MSLEDGTTGIFVACMYHIVSSFMLKTLLTNGKPVSFWGKKEKKELYMKLLQVNENKC